MAAKTTPMGIAIDWANPPPSKKVKLIIAQLWLYRLSHATSSQVTAAPIIRWVPNAIQSHYTLISIRNQWQNF